MRKTILTILLLYLTISWSQQKEISFQEYKYSRSKGFKITVTELQEEMLIEVSLLDSLSSNMEEDKHYKKHAKRSNNLNFDEMQDINLLKALAVDYNKIFNKYVFQTKDSIRLSKSRHPDFYNSFRQIFKTPLNVLENKNPSRIVLDGQSQSVIIRNNSRVVFLPILSPTKSSHPILFNFLKEAIDLFRQQKTSFLTSEYTFGK